MPKKGELKNRTGEINYNKHGEKMIIIDDSGGCCNLKIQFEDGTIVTRAYKEFKTGNIKNHNSISTCLGGIFGKERKMNSSDRNDLCYNTWGHMMRRCYDESLRKKYPTYKNCIVCEEWHNYSNFYEWYNKNYCQFGYGSMCLDKDILLKGNKVYSPKTCIFVDNRINCLFTKTNATRGKYPIGVYFNKKNNKFVAQCSIIMDNGKKQQKYLGIYNDQNEAFYKYKEFKEKYIKEIANEYKEKYENFPKKLYDAMYNYEVEITD